MEKNRAGNNAWKVIDDITTKFYVMNFPSGTSTAELRKLCSKFGRVADVYVHPHLSKYGKRFAFVKYLNINSDHERDDTVKNIRSIWIGGHHIYASVARFGHRDAFRSAKTIGVNVINKPNPHMMFKPKHQVQTKVTGSYADVARGKEPLVGKEEESKVKKWCVELPEECVVSLLNQSLHRLVAMKDPMVIKNFPKICFEEGFEVGVRYVGGRWLLVTFNCTMAVEGFMKCGAIMNMVKDIREVADIFVVEEKLIWVDVRGLPACAWNDKAIRHIVERWGELMFYEEDADYPLASRRVCIACSKNELINEDIQVIVKKKVYDVKVKGLIEWEVEIMKVDEEDDDGDRGSESRSERESEFEEHIDIEKQEDEEEEIHGSTKNTCNSTEEHTNSTFKKVGPYDCGVTERKKKNKTQKIDDEKVKNDLMKDLFGSKSLEEGEVQKDQCSRNSEVNSWPMYGPFMGQMESLAQTNINSNSFLGSRDTQKMEKTRIVMEANSRSFNSKGSLKEAFQHEEIDRFVELGKMLGINMGTKEEVQNRLVSMGVVHVDQ